MIAAVALVKSDGCGPVDRALAPPTFAKRYNALNSSAVAAKHFTLTRATRAAMLAAFAGGGEEVMAECLVQDPFS